MRGGRRTLPTLALLLVAAATSSGHVPITAPSGAALRWKGPSVPFLLNPTGSDDVADGSELTALRIAFDAWNEVLASGLHLEEVPGPKPTSLDVDDLSTHRVVFDEEDATGYFPAKTGIVALTPIRSDAQGRIVDADVIFNGRDHAFSTSLEPGAFDVRDVASHEIGHFLGLDHAPQPGATMFPYVAHAETSKRSLSEDEKAGARATYGDGGGSLTGVVLSAGGGDPLRGAYVWARRADGTALAGALTQSDGSFALAGLEPGALELSVTPLDGPMTGANLVSSMQVDFDFGSHAETVPWTVTAGSAVSIGALTAGAASGPTITWVAPSRPIRLEAGKPVNASVSGENLVAGCDVSVPGIVVDSVQPVAGGQLLLFRLTAPAGAALGLRDVTVTDPSGRTAIEAGAVEVVLPAPIVGPIAPAIAKAVDGASVTIGGSGFVTGARAVFGDVEAAVTFVSSTEIHAELPAIAAGHPPGAVDVVVSNPDGQEGRLVGAFTFEAAPAISSVFPAVASMSGGKHVKVNGVDFAPGATVSFGPGSIAATIVDATATCIEVSVPALFPGKHDLLVSNPDGSSALLAGAYEAVAQPDPALMLVLPTLASPAGGTLVSLTGSGFSPGASVHFGADPDSGAGGKKALSVTWISSTELQAVAPSGKAGASTVLVANPSGQSALAIGFEYGGSSGSSGGGGCAALAPRFPGDGGGGTPLNFAALLVAAAAVAVRARRVRSAACPATR